MASLVRFDGPLVGYGAAGRGCDQELVESLGDEIGLYLHAEIGVIADIRGPPVASVV